MNDRSDLVRGWLGKADNDRLAVINLLNAAGPHDAACFHAQQAVEKYLKGFLDFHGVDFPYKHDLVELAGLCETVVRLPELADEDLAGLTAYAVQLRYDMGFAPPRAEVEAALAAVDRIRAMIVAELPASARP